MSLHVIWLQVAIDEYHEAIDWYTKIRPQLGALFADSIEAAVLKIATHPRHCAFVSKRYRRASVEHFPYGLFFACQQDRITIVACHHAKRNPRRWQLR